LVKFALLYPLNGPDPATPDSEAASPLGQRRAALAQSSGRHARMSAAEDGKDAATVVGSRESLATKKARWGGCWAPCDSTTG
jgi:hypothetical protein